MSQLDSILQELQRADYPDEYGDTEKTVRKSPDYRASREAATTQLKDLMLSLVGEDEDEETYVPESELVSAHLKQNYSAIRRNLLRAEIRKRIGEL